ncbi:MAG: hypothetical protein RSF92_11170 [Niameybacter sp.]
MKDNINKNMYIYKVLTVIVSILLLFSLSACDMKNGISEEQREQYKKETK